jgi:hypothetical protein
MLLTRDVKETFLARIQCDPAFVQALRDEAGALVATGDLCTAKVLLDSLQTAMTQETIAHKNIFTAPSKPT